MTFQELAQIAEIVAALATMGTLIFVAFEMRARRKQDRLTMLTTLDKSWNDIMRQAGASEQTAQMFWTGLYDPDKLTEAQFAQFRSITLQFINNHRTLFDLMRNGSLGSHHEQWLKYDMERLYKLPGFWKIFLETEGLADPKFVEYVKAARRESA